MSIPAATKPWVITPLRDGSYQAKIVLTGASQVSDVLIMADMPIDTVHIYGTFNAQTVSVLGFNADPVADASIATPQALHQAHAPSTTFSAVAAELLAGVIEVPRYIVAQSNGAVTSVSIVAIFTHQRTR